MTVRPAVIALLGVSTLGAQTWYTFYSAYEDGLAAQKRGQHALALQAFDRAVALQPKPGTKVATYGLNFLAAYHPYLRLAESALAMGDLARAEAALGESARFGVEPAQARQALLARIGEQREAARPAPLKPQPPPEPAPQPLSRPVEEAPPPEPARTVQVEAPAKAPEKVNKPQILPQKQPAEQQPIEQHPVLAPAPAPVPVAVPPPPARAWGGPLAVLGGLLAVGAAFLARRRRPAPATVALDLDERPAFGPWLALRKVGQGGNATTYFGVHSETGQEAAIKVPHPHLLENPDCVARFRREALLGARLDHPRLVRILDPGPPEGDPWLVMAFVHGETLEEHLARTPRLPVAEAVQIARDVAEAMAYAHARGVVHRDLKPGNIMLGKEGAVLLDLGIARLAEGTNKTSMYLGTPTYSAPESMADPSVGPAADTYALGIILYEMLAGEPPFCGGTPFQVLEGHCFDPLPPLGRPQVPAALVTLIERLCAKKPEDRPSDGACLEALARF